MEHAMNLVLGLLLGLFNLVAAAIGVIEGFARRLLADIGIGGELQTIILIVLLVLLIVAAIRVFGRLFGVLIAVFLLLLLFHALLGNGHVAGTPI
ncbi:hypothetical protein HN018_07055 [Lichenicola cladoniae]|uniref:Uncharacterized protein n=2 Tax=Lichenicola cladoniae TaxID=1484109 RepID=A0A6M8HN33_9PROT|nr:hypothetical protein [Acetobacteraceae bacterium]QKE89833.1 hypothetical protein HN018_07055 [Lichenicola cladoniae]